MPSAQLTSAQSRMCALVYGNTAKVYDLAIVADLARDGRPLRVIDLGCGTAAIIEPVLREFPAIEYLGIEPDRHDAERASVRLRGVNASVLSQMAYSLQREHVGRFDVALSFSTLEHVVHRDRYLATAAAALRDGGSVLMNYDHGHFVNGSWRDAAKRIAGPVLARLGDESKYQRFVRYTDVVREAHAAGFVVRERKFFNLRSFKQLSHRIPPDAHAAYQAYWLASELAANQHVTYDDALAGEIFTVNLVLVKETPG